MKRLLLVLLLSASMLSGCGFKLRGSIDLPESIRSVSVSSPDVKLRDIIADRLESNNVSVTAEGSGSAQINIESADISREVTTIDERGKATGYNLIMRARYNVVDARRYPTPV